MARTAIKASSLSRVAALKAKKEADSSVQERIRAMDKKFASMTRGEKDELLFKLCLDAGILPKETE